MISSRILQQSNDVFILAPAEIVRPAHDHVEQVLVIITRTEVEIQESIRQVSDLAHVRRQQGHFFPHSLLTLTILPLLRLYKVI